MIPICFTYCITVRCTTHSYPLTLRIQYLTQEEKRKKAANASTSSRRNFLRARLTPILTESTTLVSPKNPWRPPRPRDLFSDPWSCVHLPYSQCCGSGMICFGSDFKWSFCSDSGAGSCFGSGNGLRLERVAGQTRTLFVKLLRFIKFPGLKTNAFCNISFSGTNFGKKDFYLN